MGFDKMVIGCIDGNNSNEFHKHLGGKYVKQRIFKTLQLPENVYYFEKKISISERKNMALNKDLEKYIEENIFPKYERFYSHGMIHINNVINNMLMLAKYYDLDENMAYVIASYHDSGLENDRENHEYESGKILSNDAELKKYFTEEQIEIMKEAIEDHRGSRKIRPRNFYGECVSDSDRDFDIKLLAKRQISTSIKNYPDIQTFDEHFERCYQYICSRINDNGKFNLWTNNPMFVEQRDRFQKDYLNKEYARSIYKKEWDRITKDGTYEKIKNYYLDY